MGDNRKYIIQAVFILIGLIYLMKLFFIQVIDSTYKLAAEDNVMRKITEYPFRGLIYDRNHKLLVYNEPVYDLMVVPKEVRMKDTIRFCEVLGLDTATFSSKMEGAKSYSWVRPSVFMKMLSNKTFAEFQDLLIDYPGFYVQSRTLRGYDHNSMANALGYIGEISKQALARDTTDYYKQGDYVGISGIERYYEKELRGEQGVKYKMVNVRGVEKGAFKDGKYDKPSVPGNNLISTIDLDLQEYGETLMEGKAGAIVAIEPATGEVLSLVSAPSYDPETLVGRQFGKNYIALSKDSLTPLFNRAIMSVYPPGSTFKPLQALIGLQEGVIKADENIFCAGNLVGDHAPPGYYNVYNSIQKSSNNYYYIVFKRIINQELSDNTFIDSKLGLEKWDEYLSRFGLGAPVGIDIPNEKGGMIPSPAYYNKIYGENRWKWSTINSVSIGQGEILISPLQMANYAAIIANRGFYYKPHVIKAIGEDGLPLSEYREKQEVGIDPAHFESVIQGMRMVIDGGTGFRADVEGLDVCGKTGTSQNPHGEDHSVFIAFAPRENPKIAISVYVQNAGQGARAAASIAGLMIEKYLKGEIERKWIEEYALRGEFIY